MHTGRNYVRNVVNSQSEFDENAFGMLWSSDRKNFRDKWGIRKWLALVHKAHLKIRGKVEKSSAPKMWREDGRVSHSSEKERK